MIDFWSRLIPSRREMSKVVGDYLKTHPQYDFSTACLTLRTTIATRKPWKFYKNLEEFRKALEQYTPGTQEDRELLNFDMGSVKLIERFPGDFAATDLEGRMVGIGKTPSEAVNKAKARGELDPVLFRIPRSADAQFF